MGCRDYLKIKPLKKKKRNFIANMFLVVIPTRGLLRKMFLKSPGGIEQGDKNSQQLINTGQRKKDAISRIPESSLRKRKRLCKKSPEGLFQTVPAALTEYCSSKNVMSF